MSQDFVKVEFPFWQVNTLRLTSFFSSPEPTKKQNWWMEVVGQPPDSRQEQPKLGQSLEESLFDGKRLQLRVEPARVDWILSAPPEQNIQIPVLDTQGATELFFINIFKWLSGIPQIQRIAFGSVLLQKTENHQTGYSKLGDYLKDYVKIDVNSQDFNYRINRIRKSKNMDNLRINRLSIWSLLMSFNVQILNIREQEQQIIPSANEFACRLELDVNTVPDSKVNFNSTESIEITKELIELSNEISAQGDVE